MAGIHRHKGGCFLTDTSTFMKLGNALFPVCCVGFVKAHFHTFQTRLCAFVAFVNAGLIFIIHIYNPHKLTPVDFISTIISEKLKFMWDDIR
jgi:hypothetical protein